MEKKHQDILVVLILWLFTSVFFLLQVSSIWQTAVVVIIYTLMAGSSLIVLLFLKSDAAYYENLTGTYLLFVIMATAVMYGVSLVCANYFPATEVPLTTIPGATSIITSLISDILFTFVMVALSEEVLKLGGYAEFKERYKGHWYRWLIALFPVVLWAGFHAIQAYNNLWYLIPAFIDGLVLLALLETTKCFLTPILAHGAYNTILIVTSYMVSAPALPLFPPIASATDFLLITLCIAWVAFIIGPVIQRARSSSSKQSPRRRR
jgi:membrane protease YdiL (CAAX protease family)